MATVSALFLNIQTFLNMQTAGNAQYVNLNTAPTKILAWMNTMNKYAQGIYKDGVGAAGDADPYNAINHLNLLTLSYNSTSVTKICANDLWVYDATNCTYAGS
jgi:hypothetical protein